MERTAVPWRRLRGAASIGRAGALPGQIAVSEARVSVAAGSSLASYTVSNQSIYSFWQPRFLLVLTRAGQIAALGLNELPELPAGGQFNLESRVLASVAGASLEVYPIIDVLDPAVYYLPPGGVPKF